MVARFTLTGVKIKELEGWSKHPQVKNDRVKQYDDGVINKLSVQMVSYLTQRLMSRLLYSHYHELFSAKFITRGMLFSVSLLK